MEKVFECFVHCMKSLDEKVRLKALHGLGYFLQKHPEFLLDERLIRTLLEIIKAPVSSSSSSSSSFSNTMTFCALRILQNFFRNNDVKTFPGNHSSETFSLKGISEGCSSSVSQIAQTFLNQTLQNFLNVDLMIRATSLDIVTSMLYQGLVHPAVCLPYLVCSSSIFHQSTSEIADIFNKSEGMLNIIHSKYPSFFYASAVPGLRLSYQLYAVLASSKDQIVRGCVEEDGKTVACMKSLFIIIRNNLTQCHGFLQSVLKCFAYSITLEPQKYVIYELLYMADNLAYFSYISLEEPLFIINQIDLILSCSGSTIFKELTKILVSGSKSKKRSTNKRKNKKSKQESLHSRARNVDKNNDCNQCEDDFNCSRTVLQGIINKLPEEMFRKMIDIYSSALKCLLIICLRNHLKGLYNVNDRNIQEYLSHNDGKAFSKPVRRKEGALFQPSLVIGFVTYGKMDAVAIIDCYVELKSHLESRELNNESASELK